MTLAPALPSSDLARKRWGAYWSGVRNRRWLAARELIELSPRLVDLYAERVRLTTRDASQDDCADGELWLFWDSAAEFALQRAGLSGGERRLAGAVAALTTEHCWLDVDDLAVEGTWTDGMWSVLVQWASAGRLTVAEAAEPAAWLDQSRGWVLCPTCAGVRGAGISDARPGAVCGDCGRTAARPAPARPAGDVATCPGGSR